MNIKYPLIISASLLFVVTTQANPYNVNYFLKNPADIDEQLDICNIQVWKAKESGNLANVKSAKNNPACVAAKKAKRKIREIKIAKANKAYDARQKAWKILRKQARNLAKHNTIKQLQTKKKYCNDIPHSILGKSGSDCAKITYAIQERKKLDTTVAISNYRTKSGRMSEKERFILLAQTGKCQNKYGREKCQKIRESQYLDKQNYEKIFKKNHKIAQATVARCKPAFFKALKKARALDNAGDRMRAESAIINLENPPFNNPLACKTAASALGTSFGMIAYEKIE